MPSTTPLGIPYLLGTDPANQIATVDENQANWLDPRMRNASGLVTIPVANSASGSVTITFPSGRFTAPPHITATVQGNAVVYPFIATVAAISATSANVWVRHADNNASTANVVVRWVAIQAWP